MGRLESRVENLLNLELLVVIDVLKLNSLHYGYWVTNDKDSLDLADIREAQSKYTETLLDLIPRGVDTILDVGCGVGDISLALARRGYRVTAISPHGNHRKVFCSADGIDYHGVRFEECEIDNKFTLILMSESQNYFDIDIGFERCRRYLESGGYLLVSGIFRKDNTKEFNNIPCIEESYVKKAQSYNLTLIETIDITSNILPTLKFAQENYNKYIIPSLVVLEELFANVSPGKSKLLKLIFSKELKILNQLKEYFEQRLDPMLFEKYAKYLRMLFRFG